MNWRKSRYSGSNGGNCIEVAANADVMVRDTEDRDGVTLAFSPQAWAKFLGALR